MRPEMPFLAAGAITISAGAAKAHGWPPNGARALIGTIGLVIVASATTGSAVAPIIRAMGLLVLLVAILAAVPVWTAARKGKS